MQERKLEKMKHENECLDKTVEESNISVKALNTTITNQPTQQQVSSGMKYHLLKKWT